MRQLACLLAFAGTLPFTGSVQAHGAEWELRLLGARVGNHTVTMRTAPRPPRVGPLHVEVQLIDPQTLRYVETATIVASATRVGGGSAGPQAARLRSPWHEIDLELPKSGPWDVDIVIDAGARGNVSFRVDVLPEDSE